MQGKFELAFAEREEEDCIIALAQQREMKLAQTDSLKTIYFALFYPVSEFSWGTKS